MAQAGLIAAIFVWLTLGFDRDSPGSIAAAIIVASFLSFIPFAINGMVSWLVLTGQQRGRALATVLSALSVLIWVARGWPGLIIAALALVTIIVVWQRDTVHGEVGIRLAPPLR